MKLNELTLTQALKLLGKKEISITDLYTDTFTAITKDNHNLNIYLTINKDAQKIANTKKSTPLKGIPIAVKDNFLTTHLPTTASSKVLEGFVSPYESTVTRRLQEAGGVIIGKTNMDAWAHGSSTETSDYGSTKNPRNSNHLPGGSSGGSAAAVAANMCVIAIGSETAGSIRQPAAWCGVVGLKPTYGRVSRAGVVAMGSSLDSPGPIGKTVEDVALLFNYIAGHDQYDGTAGSYAVPDLTKSLAKGVGGMRIGVCYTDHEKIRGTDVAHAMKAVTTQFEQLGASVEQVKTSTALEKEKILTPNYAVAVYTVIQRGEVSSNLARYDGIRYGNGRSYFGDEAKRRIMLGTFTLSKGYADKYYIKAQQVRNLYIQNYAELFTKYDVLISPTSPGYALKHGATKDNPMFGELEDMLVEPSSISGLPGISVPMHHDPKTNLYLGLNIIGAQWQEEKVICAAAAYERSTNWNSWLSK